MNLIFDLNSLRPPRSGVGYYTQHLLEGLLASGACEDIVGWLSRGVLEGRALDTLLRDAVFDDEGARLGSKARALLQKSRSIPGMYRVRTLVRNARSFPLRSAYAKKGYIYHETNFVASPYGGRSVVTVHDLSHVRHPEFHPTVAVNYLNRGLPRSLRDAAAVIAVSDYTKREIRDFYDVPDEAIRTIHLGVDEIFHARSAAECSLFLTRRNLRYKGFILSVCTLQPRKNLMRLVRAFLTLPTAMQEAFPLVLIGADGWKNATLREILQPLIAKGNAVVLGYVSRTELSYLYAAAAMFAYPSLYEGFGLPVAEGMASGVPVLTSNATCLPEIAGDAALFVDPLSLDAIRNGMIQLLDDSSLRSNLTEKGLARAQALTWSKMINSTIDLYRSVAKT